VGRPTPTSEFIVRNASPACSHSPPAHTVVNSPHKAGERNTAKPAGNGYRTGRGYVMPRCLHLHKVPHDAGFCAVCGARALPDWVWLCLSVLPLSLIYAVALSSRATKSPVALPPVVETRLIEVTRLVEAPLMITATEPAYTPTRPLPTVAPSRTWTPTPSPSSTATATPTATLYPRVALMSFHDLYVIAKGKEDGWALKQETRLDVKCGWFAVSPQGDGKVALLTCYNRYVTASRTGITRRDWLLRQETKLDECGKFTIHDLGNGEVAFETCAGRFFTAGNDSWSGLQWLLVAETKEIQDWEKFALRPLR
jgi:hypothetical protein